MPTFSVPQLALPMVTSPGHDETNAPPLPTAGDTVMLLRTQAARPLILTRRIFRLGVLPFGLLWLGTNFWRMRKLHRSFSTQVAELARAGPSLHRISFAAFLSANLDSEMNAAAREALAIQEQRSTLSA